MKANKLLSLMAIAACFAACTKEVLVQPEEAIDSFDKVKGAKMLANGFTINPNSDAQTKVSVENGVADFRDGDKAGVAWFVVGKVADDQSDPESQNKLFSTAYANHKLTYNETNERFESNSNVFEGWHVAYYPYNPITKPGAMSFKINKPMTLPLTDSDKYAEDLYENSIMLSSAYHVIDEYIKDGLIDMTMDLQFVANTLRPKFIVADNFKTSNLLDTVKITSVTLSANDKAIFTDEFTINPRKFPTSEESFAATHFGVKTSTVTDGPALQTTVYKTSVTTYLDKTIQDSYTLGSDEETLNIRMNVAPVPTNDVTVADLSITVNLSNSSSFVLKAGNEGDVNYNAFKKLADLLVATEGPSLQNIIKDETGDLSPVGKDLNFYLTPDEYKQSYIVDDNESWLSNIALATAAGVEKPTFVIQNGTTLTFPADSDGGMNVPENLKINCTTATSKDYVYFVFDEATTWASNVTVNNRVCINVNAGGKLILNADLAPNRVDVAKEATLVVGDISLDPYYINNAGTIEVSLGSDFNNQYEDKGGKVVYYAQETDSADAISTMIKNANVTDIVVNNDWTVGGVNNNTVAVEFNGAVVEFESDATFKSVNVASGVNTITGNITAPVTVAAGATLTIDGNVTGEVTVEDGGTLTINGNVSDLVTVGGKAILNGNNIGDLKIAAGAEVTVTSDDFMTINNIENNGTLNVVGINVYANNITTEAGSKTNIPDDKAIYYKNSYKNNGGTTTGSVAFINVDEENDNYYEGDGYKLIEGVYYVNSATGLATALTANKDIIVELSNDVSFSTTNLGGELTTSIVINGNGHMITFNQSETTASDAIETVNTTNPEAVLTINNATITEDSTIGQFWYNDDLIFGCKVVLTDVKATRMIAVENNATFTNFTSDCTNIEGSFYSIWIRPMTVNQVVTFNTTDNKKNLINNPNGRGIKIEKEYVAEPKHVKLNVNNTKFITGVKAAILVNTPAGATINWGEGNDISNTFDPEYPVWVDEAASTDDFLLVEGQNCTPVTESSRQKALEE